MRRVGFPAIDMIGLVFLSACGGGDSGTPPPVPTLKIGISPASVPAGQTATLTWSSNNASTCNASGAWKGPKSTSGSLGVSQANPGSYTYALDCSSGGSASTTESTALTVTAPPPPLTVTGALSNGVSGDLYDQSIQVTGGVAPYAWTVSSGALPHGLSLSPSTTNSVTISGTPDTVAQGVAFAIQVTDSANQTATQTFSVSILPQADTLVLSPAITLDFGNQIVGVSSGTHTETLINTTSSAILISGIAVVTDNQPSNPGEFTQTSTTCGSSLAAGASCAINLSFTPGQTGPRGAVLTITDNTAGSPQYVRLGGVGLTTGPNATFSAVSLPFGIELVGTTSPALTISLSDYGTAALNIGSVSATASFAESDNCVGGLAPGATCTISVTFTPGGAGGVSGTLSISDDAAGSPQALALSGTGATSTNPLNGDCLASCGWPGTGPGLVSDPAQCPVGQPSRHPVYVGCGLGSSVLDEGRSCTVQVGIRSYRGYCDTSVP